ncbi:MAG TPA: NAD-dependent epimerase/dehydratase family protein [Nitrososphaerales archaeon]|nr:NAD-dependent epimerase/dehydratase family protein [Nitrososphaerales archaeon]
MSRVAITGGAGFLGSHIAKQQIEKGNDVVIIDNFSSGSIENLNDLAIRQSCITGDLRNYEFARESLASVDTLYHFAAEVGSVEYLHGSNDREMDALQANLVIDTNVFRACRENQVNCVIYASSVSVYPFERQLAGGAVFKEEDATDRVNPEGGYGWSKFLGEVQLSMMKDVSIGIARIFHAYGKNIYLKPDRSQVIASLITKAINYPKDDFIVWGNGAQRRCFVFIDDVLDALDKLERYVMRNGKLVVNIGSQDEVTIKELAEEIVRISGKDIRLKFDTSKPSGALYRTPNLERIGKVLGWTPETDLSKGLSDTYEWAKTRLSV